MTFSPRMTCPPSKDGAMRTQCGISSGAIRKWYREGPNLEVEDIVVIVSNWKDSQNFPWWWRNRPLRDHLDQWNRTSLTSPGIVSPTIYVAWSGDHFVCPQLQLISPTCVVCVLHGLLEVGLLLATSNPSGNTSAQLTRFGSVSFRFLYCVVWQHRLPQTPRPTRISV
jgi:hypothetical protein